MMFEANTPNFDLDDKLKDLLKKLYKMGFQREVLGLIDKLRKTLPDMVAFYKEIRTINWQPN
jgi:translation initiation factor IF-2